ncbi:hypothetical protein ACP0J1_25620 [Pseudomonas aeruginosa]
MAGPLSKDIAQSSKQATFANEQERAIRIEGQFHTLTDRVITAGCGNKYSEEEVGAMRIRMAVLSSQYFDLTGLMRPVADPPGRVMASRA